MSALPQFQNGFLKMWRLGPIKPVKQKNNNRAPERHGLWAFPWPYYDSFFTYHRYLSKLPKEFSGNAPTDPKWLTTDEGEPIDSLEGHTINEYGYYDELTVKPEWYEIRERWIEEVGQKVERRSIFWYSGPIYTHIRNDLEVLWGDPDGEWDLTDTSSLYKLLIRNRGDVVTDSQYPRPSARYSHDHLEVFIPRGGMIRSRPR